MRRICFDLDGVICELKRPEESYFDVLPKPGAVEYLNKLKENGDYIIIHTARHMKTCEGNVGKVIQRVGKQTIDWLEKYNIPYDELYFGKPWAEIYIDDNGFRFTDWTNMPLNSEDLPKWAEKSVK